MSSNEHADEEAKEAEERWVESDVYVPPSVAWNIRVFSEAPLEAVKAKVVDCPTCPVQPQCETGYGGTGWTCPKCGSTGVNTRAPVKDQEAPDDLLILDCNKHNFERSKESAQMQKCGMCSGGVGELEVAHAGARNHMIFTIHAKVPVEQRHVDAKDSIAMWEKHYAEKNAEREK